MSKCLGLYCGRIQYSLNNYSDCGVCPRGFRVNEESGICTHCESSPQFYDWLYITFMVFLLLIIQWYITDHCIKRRQLTFDIITLHLLAALENVSALLMSILIIDPKWTFSIRTCPVKRLSDWYTLFYNPTPDFRVTIRCTHEAVYPLYTQIFIFYAFSLLFLLMRPLMLRIISFFMKIFSKSFIPELYYDESVTKTIYLTLYAIPALSVIHALFSGLIYYSFPYIIIIGSIISVSLHLAFQLDQRPSALFLSLLQKRNSVIIICHWIIHAYGIISLTEFKNPVIHAPLICIVPLPTLFYILTSKFTDPSKLNIE